MLTYVIRIYGNSNLPIMLLASHRLYLLTFQINRILFILHFRGRAV
jgi:hypothetical protein